jgi:hypothetical protein
MATALSGHVSFEDGMPTPSRGHGTRVDRSARGTDEDYSLGKHGSRNRDSIEPGMDVREHSLL